VVESTFHMMLSSTKWCFALPDLTPILVVCLCPEILLLPAAEQHPSSSDLGAEFLGSPSHAHVYPVATNPLVSSIVATGNPVQNLGESRLVQVNNPSLISGSHRDARIEVDLAPAAPTGPHGNPGADLVLSPSGARFQANSMASLAATSQPTSKAWPQAATVASLCTTSALPSVPQSSSVCPAPGVDLVLSARATCVPPGVFPHAVSIEVGSSIVGAVPPGSSLVPHFSSATLDPSSTTVVPVGESTLVSSPAGTMGAPGSSVLVPDVVATVPHQPSTHLQHGIWKPKTYIDGTVHYGMFTSTREP
jgi:hypothetical protein